MPEEMKVTDYVAVARNMLWVVNQVMVSSAQHPNFAPEHRKLVADLGFTIEELDRMRGVLDRLTYEPDMHMAGLPPNPSFHKLVEIILESYRDSGNHSVSVGESTMSIRPADHTGPTGPAGHTIGPAIGNTAGLDRPN